MMMPIVAVSIGQAFLVGDPEEDDQALVLTLNGANDTYFYCFYHNSINCNHTGAFQP
jgi:hypothetical protein